MTTETTEIIIFDDVMAKLAEFKEANANIVYDVTDPQGMKDCKSHISSLRKFKTSIATVHKEAKKEALEYGRALDALKNKYTAEVVEMIDLQKAPLDEIEAEKQAQIDADVKRHAEEEERRQAELEAKAKAYEEMQAKEAAERAEAERVVREAQIAEEAAARATAEAEAKAKLEAAAKEQARDAEIQAEIDRAEAKERAEQARIANEEHRMNIQNDIEKCLVNMGVGIETTTEILTALIGDRIPHLMIVY